MVRRLVLSLFAVLALALSGCASLQNADVVANPNFDGVYRLTYAGNGASLYYRFYADGVVVSARSEGMAQDIIETLDVANADVSRGKWAAHQGELRIGVDEGTVWYDSRFDIRPDGRIALRGLSRAFEYIPFDGEGQPLLSRR